jgi:dipeptidyl aminopeptidase/acylaminoacyl peptidase
MTSPRRFEGDLPALLADLYLVGTPDYRDDLVRQTARVRQRPAWTFPERWLPVELVTSRVSMTRLPWRQIGVLAIIAALVAAMLATLIGSRQRLPEPFGPAGNGLLVYSDAGDIYARNAPGAPGRLLIGGPEKELIVSFARRGNTLLFAREATDKSLSFWVAQPDGTGIRQLDGTYKDVSGVDWSPSGDAIAVTATQDGGDVLSIIPSDGSTATQIPLLMTAMEVGWRPPDGSQISFRGKDTSGWGLFLIQRDGSGLRRLDLVTERMSETEYDVRDHRWSDDGRQVMFDSLHDVAAGNHSGLRIHVAEIDPNGSVVSDTRYDFEGTADDELNARWLPSGDQIVYQRRLGNEGLGITDSLQIVTLEHGARPDDLGITSTSGQGVGYEVSPDGAQLISILWGEKLTYLTDLATRTSTVASFRSDEGGVWQRTALP